MGKTWSSAPGEAFASTRVGRGRLRPMMAQGETAGGRAGRGRSSVLRECGVQHWSIVPSFIFEFYE